jgi:hypothetical protein
MKNLLLTAIALVVVSIVILIGPESDLRTYLLIFLVRSGIVDGLTGVLKFMTYLLGG